MQATQAETAQVRCPGCHKAYRIKTDRLNQLASSKVFCPNCRQLIPLGIDTADTMPTAGLLYGNDLKHEVLNNFKKLYAMPHVVLKAQAMLADPNSNFDKISHILNTDQALASRVLKLANSAYFGMRGKISSVRQATVLLGVKILTHVITIAGASKMLGAALKGYALDSGALWRHSLSVAVCCQRLTDRLDPDLANQAFLAGLIHDAGKIILDEYLTERKAAFKVALNAHQSLPQAEAVVFGFDHAEVTYALCQSWAIPEQQALAVHHHHSPSAYPDSLLARILHLADVIANQNDLSSGETATQTYEDGTLAELGLAPEDIPALSEGLLNAVETLEDDTY